MEHSIAIRDLTKRYGNFTAVSGLTLEVEPGSICGLLGPNGAGKSTTFKCLLGLARPTSGSIAIEGKPLTPATFQDLAYVPEKSALYENLTLAEHLEYYRRCYARYDAARASELIDMFKLDRKKKVGKFSKGQRTAVSLILAFSLRPRIFVLDEPASGLDPIFQRLVLDLMMPEESGLSICQRLRAAGEVIPVLMLTAKGDPVDRIIGLESGADDYLAKPFTPRELVARITAQLRRRSMDARSSTAGQQQITFGPFLLDLKTRELLRDGVAVALSSVEFVVLRALAQHPNVELTRDRLLDLSKGSDSAATDRSIDVQVLRLRRSIEQDPSNPRWIKTVRGVGYVFVPDAK